MPCFRTNIGGMVAYATFSEEYKIRAGGKEFRFSFSEHLGPSMLGKRGQSLSNMPPERSPFWDALHFWIRQGQQVDSEGWCVFKWEMKPVQILKHLGGRHYMVLG